MSEDPDVLTCIGILSMGGSSRLREEFRERKVEPYLMKGVSTQQWAGGLSGCRSCLGGQTILKKIF